MKIVGDAKSVWVTIGASNHTENEREENDFYATEPHATEVLLGQEKFKPLIWECASGAGHISNVLEKHGYNVITSDLIDRGKCDFLFDFLKAKKGFSGDIITNPPYRYALEFVQKALDIIPSGGKVAMFLKLTFMESQKRKKLFLENPPKVIYVSSSRLTCAKNGDFKRYKQGAIAYAWYVWEKGYKGETVIKWVN